MTSKEALTKVLQGLSAEDRATVEQAISDIEAASATAAGEVAVKTEPGVVLNVVHKGSLIFLSIFVPVGLYFLLMGVGAVPMSENLTHILGEYQIVFFLFGLNMIFGVLGSYGMFGTTKFGTNISTVSMMFLIAMFMIAMLRHLQTDTTVIPPFLVALVGVCHLCSGPPATRETHVVCKPCLEISCSKIFGKAPSQE